MKKILMVIIEIAAWLSIAVFISAHVYGLKTQCENTAIYVNCNK